VLLNAGRVALRLGRVPDARAFFDQVLSQGRDPEVAVKVAFAFLASGQLRLAGDVLDRARTEGGEPRLHFYAGLVHERVRAWQRAADAFALVPAGLGEVSFEARLHRGICLSQLGQHRAAIELLRRLQEDRAELSGLAPALARALERAGQHKDAEATLVRAVARASSSETLEALAAFFARQGRFAEALSVLAGALARAPRDEVLLFALAGVYEKQGDWQRGIEKVRLVLEADPKHTGALNYIGYTLAQHGGDLAEAERLVRRALELKPDSAAYLDSLGWVLLKRGDAAGALELLERAVAVGSEDATVYEHLGEAALALGRSERALEAFARARELLLLAPDDAERPGQRAAVEQRLKLLSPERKGR
jgi:tetratricopeptide (TPR) repeat protein